MCVCPYLDQIPCYRTLAMEIGLWRSECPLSIVFGLAVTSTFPWRLFSLLLSLQEQLLPCRKEFLDWEPGQMPLWVPMGQVSDCGLALPWQPWASHIYFEVSWASCCFVEGSISMWWSPRVHWSASCVVGARCQVQVGGSRHTPFWPSPNRIV